MLAESVFTRDQNEIRAASIELRCSPKIGRKRSGTSAELHHPNHK